MIITFKDEGGGGWGLKRCHPDAEQTNLSYNSSNMNNFQ